MKRAQDQKNGANTQYTVAFSATTMEQTANGQWVLDSGQQQSSWQQVWFSASAAVKSLKPETETVSLRLSLYVFHT